MPITILLTLLCTPKVRAQGSITAASCSSTDVQAAINSATPGQTVNVPPGSCTWTTPVTITKPLILDGQTTCSSAGTASASCNDLTTITLDVSGDTSSLSLSGGSAGSPTEILGVTFVFPQAYVYNGAINFSGSSPPFVGFRLADCHFIFQSGATGSVGLAVHQIYGVVDHNLFDVGSAGNADPLAIFGDGFSSWERPLALGTDQAFYIESNTYNCTSYNTEAPEDTYGGARFVYRYNYDNGCDGLGEHGTDSGPYRSTFSFESYHNSFVNNVGSTYNSAYLRGGTAIVWGNTYGGSTSWSGISLNCFRCGAGESGALSVIGNWGLADGTPWLLTSLTSYSNSSNASSWTANTPYSGGTYILPAAPSQTFRAKGNCTSGASAPAWNTKLGATTADGTCSWYNEGGVGSGSGYYHWCSNALDTPATSDSQCPTGGTATAFFDGSGLAGYPARDQVGRTSNQAAAPVYEWLEGPDHGIFGAGGVASGYINANRDYYAYTSSFTGSSGVGSGLLSARPTTCTPLVAYWATDANTLYQCSSPNTWTAYYSPYQYPHPLDKPVGPNPPTAATAVPH